MIEAGDFASVCEVTKDCGINFDMLSETCWTQQQSGSPVYVSPKLQVNWQTACETLRSARQFEWFWMPAILIIYNRRHCTAAVSNGRICSFQPCSISLSLHILITGFCKLYWCLRRMSQLHFSGLFRHIKNEWKRFRIGLIEVETNALRRDLLSPDFFIHQILVLTLHSVSFASKN